MAFTRTTGPISSSLGLDHIRIVTLNNTGVNKKVRLVLYNLSNTSKRIVFDRNISLRPYSSSTIDTPASNITRWEVQAVTDSNSVRFWVGGQDENMMNLVGNVVLDSEMKRI